MLIGEAKAAFSLIASAVPPWANSVTRPAANSGPLPIRFIGSFQIWGFNPDPQLMQFEPNAALYARKSRQDSNCSGRMDAASLDKKKHGSDCAAQPAQESLVHDALKCEISMPH